MLKPVLALAAGLALSLSATLAQAADVLKVSAIPDEAPTELLRKFQPLGAYLEKELGMKVEFVPVADEPECRWVDRDDDQIRGLVQLADLVLAKLRAFRV